MGERLMAMSLLVDTNILIYHTEGIREASEFLAGIINDGYFNISILTKIEFLGWNRHTVEGFDKCRRLVEAANVFPVGDAVANRAIELRRRQNIKLADAVIAATALVGNLRLATRNVADFRGIEGLETLNPFG
jgi:toxin FitB